MKFSKRKLKKIVLDYLSKNKLMSLATVDAGKPWAATVFFAYDKKLNLIFYSRSDTKHIKNIKRNNTVSITINQYWGEAGFVKGIQILGKISKIKSKGYFKYYKIFKSRYAWADKYPDHLIYLVKPLELYYIDHKLFGHFFKVRVI